MKNKIQIIFFIIFSIILFYAIIKERRALGCKKLGIDAQCHYDNTLLFMNSKPDNNNDKESILYKLKYIIEKKYGEASSKWRLNYIFSFILTLLLCVSFCTIKNFNFFNYFLISFPIIFLFIILYERFIYYHYTKVLEINGDKLIKQLEKY